MKPPMPWIGGKQALTALLASLFPLSFAKYVEVFGGGGALLFYKEPENHHEIYNDKNRLLCNFFRCVREYPEQLISELEFAINSREDFKYNREILRQDFELPNTRMAARYYQNVILSYAANATSYGGSPRSMWSRFPAILAASARLQNVVIENKDFQPLFLQRDAADTLFYIDPPYFDTEDYYEQVDFTKTDHLRLAELIANAKGYVLLSYNHCDEIVKLYSKPGFMIIPTTRLSNIAQRYEGGKQYGELIIGNYDLFQRRNSCRQLSLWGDAPEEINERNVIFNGIQIYTNPRRGL